MKPDNLTRTQFRLIKKANKLPTYSQILRLKQIKKHKEGTINE